MGLRLNNWHISLINPLPIASSWLQQQQQQQTMNSAALSPYFCPYLIESSALLHLYIIATIPIRDAVEKYRVIRRNAAEIHRRMPYNKNNTNNNAVTIASLLLYHRTLGIYCKLWIFLPTERHHQLPPTTVSCRSNVEIIGNDILCVNDNGRPSLIHQYIPSSSVVLYAP